MVSKELSLIIHISYFRADTEGMDSDLKLALALSADEASRNSSLILGKTFETRRTSLSVRQDKHAQSTIVEGKVVQVNTLDQFNEKFLSISRRFSGPHSMCGFLVCANAILLQRYFDRKGSYQKGYSLSIEDLCEIYRDLVNVEAVEEHVCNAVHETQTTRKGFVIEHARQNQLNDLERDKMIRDSLGQWVANFEVSDFLKRYSTHHDAFFFRKNQYPERDDASPDERIRIEEEACFGGWRDGEEMKYGQNDSVYFLERFLPEPRFLSPIEWHSLPEEKRSARFQPKILALDLNGHFVAAVMCWSTIDPQSVADLASLADTTNSRDGAVDKRGCDPEPTLLIFNTTGTNYIPNHTIPWVFDSFV